MIGIKALTGISPHDLPRDENEEIKWSDKALVSQGFAQILSKMVREDFKQRYQSALAVLAALDQLANTPDKNFGQQNNSSMNTIISIDESDLPTAHWP